MHFTYHSVVTTLLFNPTLFLATQTVSMSLNMKPREEGTLYLMCCKKESDDWCQRMGGPRNVKPIFTSSQPSNLSNYSLFQRADRGDYQYIEKERWFFSEAPCLSLQSVKHRLLTPIPPFSRFLSFYMSYS